MIDGRNYNNHNGATKNPQSNAILQIKFFMAQPATVQGGPKKLDYFWGSVIFLITIIKTK